MDMEQEILDDKVAISLLESTDKLIDKHKEMLESYDIMQAILDSIENEINQT